MKATPATFLQMKYFKISENWGDFKRMDEGLLYMLDAYRELVKTPIYISCGTQGRHVTGSLHYSGNAVDALFTHKLMADLPELAEKALSMSFSVGIYNCWEYNGVSTPGIHLDNRMGKQKKWIGIEGMYLPWNDVNLKRYFLDFQPNE